MAASVLFPLPSPAACAPGTMPAYDDIRYVSVVQYSLLAGTWPDYSYEATYFPAATGSERATVRLTAKRNVGLKGAFVASDPVASFRETLGVLKAVSFFDIRLDSTKGGYLDGLEDIITVAACGIRWSLGTIVPPGQVALDDADARRFFTLEKNANVDFFRLLDRSDPGAITRSPDAWHAPGRQWIG